MCPCSLARIPTGHTGCYETVSYYLLVLRRLLLLMYSYRLSDCLAAAQNWLIHKRLSHAPHGSHVAPFVWGLSSLVCETRTQEASIFDSLYEYKSGSFYFFWQISQALALFCLVCFTTCSVHLTKYLRNLSISVLSGHPHSFQLQNTLGYHSVVTQFPI